MRKVKWKDKNDVIKYCQEVNAIARKGYESLVIQYKGRLDYNITHVAARERYDRSDVTIIWHPHRG